MDCSIDCDDKSNAVKVNKSYASVEDDHMCTGVDHSTDGDVKTNDDLSNSIGHVPKMGRGLSGIARGGGTPPIKQFELQDLCLSMNEENDRILAGGVSEWKEEFNAEVHAQVNGSRGKNLAIEESN